MKYIFFFILVNASSLYAQQIKNDTIIADIKETINYLADDKLEGRRTGTAGEKLAYEFIIKKFETDGLTPLGDNGNFIQTFEVKEGKGLTKKNSLIMGNNKFKLNEDYFPMPYSSLGLFNLSKHHKSGSLFINDLIDANKGNPHFDLKEEILNKIKESEKNGSAVFFICDTSTLIEKFDEKDKTSSVTIPVFYLTATGTKKFLSSTHSSYNVSSDVEIQPKNVNGHNIIGYINNNAPATIILGAHYDHLGYGQDHNSLYTGAIPMIHNGADDNASGTAALISLGKWLKTSSLKKYNYIFIAFSGEELGLYGSKYFTEHSPVDLKTINYMINMDMLGRLNDSTHGLTIGGYGTSPAWGEIIKTEDNYFKIKMDSSGSGPSDHTSFYRKDIPVLFFFTGTHSDYHKPSDDADKINFSGEIAVINYIKRVLLATDQKEKIAFTKTRETSIGKTSFRVTLGIMPDYTFSGNGVLVDGISEGRPAQRAGIKTGDVLYQLGDHPFSDVETYMQVLNKFNKGEATKVKIKRGKEDIELPVVF